MGTEVRNKGRREMREVRNRVGERVREIKITRKREIINEEGEKDHVKHALHTPD